MTIRSRKGSCSERTRGGGRQEKLDGFAAFFSTLVDNGIMVNTASAGRVKVTLVRSTIGFDKRQANVVRGLGLRRRRSLEVERADGSLERVIAGDVTLSGDGAPR